MSNEQYKFSEEMLCAFEKEFNCLVNIIYADTLNVVTIKYYNPERTQRNRVEYTTDEAYKLINSWWQTHKPVKEYRS